MAEMTRETTETITIQLTGDEVATAIINYARVFLINANLTPKNYDIKAYVEFDECGAVIASVVATKTFGEGS